MTTFIALTVVGLVVGCIYALSATGLVVTYTTSGVFNFAHGAIGMIAAFAYWQLSEGWGWPAPASLVLVLFVIAPLLGALVERLLIRPLHGAAVDLSLVVTLGLLLALIGVANLVWNPTTYRTVPKFFAGGTLMIGGVRLSLHEMIVIAVALVVAVALRLLFTRTRTGIAMRAVVDSPTLAARNGVSPARIQQLSWALGASLAAAAGIMLAAIYRLDALLLTLLVINGYAAAAVGRLKSLPLTVIGALSLGLVVSYGVGYLPGAGGFLSEIQLILPMAFLFVVLIVLRHDRLRAGRATAARAPSPPTVGRAAGWGAAVVAGAVALSVTLSPADLGTASRGFIVAFVLLSLVLLTGYGGLTSLCQMTFVGVGAFAMGRFGDGGSLLGVVAAVVLAAAVGALVALPTLKLRGLYLALATLAFAQALDSIFFVRAFVQEGGFDIDRVAVPFLGRSDRAYLVFVAIVFAVAGVGIVALRRGRFGRRLFALNDSPAACATLGLNVNWTKLAAFTASAGMAGLGGALLGGLFGTASDNQFLMLNSLVLLLLLRIGGVNTVTGAFLGAVVFVLFPVLQRHFPVLSDLNYVFTGLAAISLAREPNGIAGHIAIGGERLRARRRERRGPQGGEAPAFAEPSDAEVDAARPAMEPSGDRPLLIVEDVTVRFGGVLALDGVSLSAEAGKITGLIGPNGAGKTTLFNVVTGLERPSRGRVFLAGRDVTNEPAYERARLGIARTFQRLEPFSSLSVRDNVRAGAEFRRSWARDGADPSATTDAVLGLVGLRDVADRAVEELPTGLGRLVELGRALATRPSVVLLDEPSSGLNQDETRTLARLLRALADRGTAIVLVEHDMGLVMDVCDVIHVLDFGRIISVGTPREVQSDPVVQGAYLGDETLLQEAIV